MGKDKLGECEFCFSENLELHNYPTIHPGEKGEPLKEDYWLCKLCARQQAPIWARSPIMAEKKSTSIDFARTACVIVNQIRGEIEGMIAHLKTGIDSERTE